MAVLETWYALLVAVEAADLKRTHPFGIMAGLVIPGGLLRSWHKCQNVSFNEPVWQSEPAT
jgi:hypothetical protein